MSAPEAAGIPVVPLTPAELEELARPELLAVLQTLIAACGRLAPAVAGGAAWEQERTKYHGSLQIVALALRDASRRLQALTDALDAARAHWDRRR